MSRLKNCPFCGSEVELEKIPLWNGSHGYHGNYEFKIKCKNCGCKVDQHQTDTVYRDEETAKSNAIKLWNRRVDSDWKYITEEIERTVKEIEDNGKYHADFVKRNGDMICEGLKIALQIINGRLDGSGG